MRHYLFYDEKQKETIFQRKSNFLWTFFLVLMWFFAFVAMGEDNLLFIILLLCGLLFFPGIPLLLKCYVKAYYIELLDEYIICAGKVNNIFGKARITYEEIYYIETEKQEPQIYPRGTTPEQMVKKFGRFINVYDKDKKCLFSFRDNALITKKLLEMNSNAQVIERLN